MWTAEPSTLVAVEVTFMRMDAPPPPGQPALPDGWRVTRLRPRCSVQQYRRLYDGVGRDYVWWLRRSLSDAELDEVLAEPTLSVHVLHDPAGREAGFYELDRRPRGVINLAYFGLMPGAIGQGLGMAFLHHAIAAAWAEGPSALTVNTCTADHPRALPNYLKAGFRVLRVVREEWPIPDRLGLPIPDRLKV
ncbi:GNAT family protein [Rubritepida flocculans]|uniref:acetyltransferase n=1 Tax=Rubritepida flocculans TaxID=182403 RepID=UPI0004289132|nr:acetyltransferase [Rubritepida flocculans]